MSNVPTKPNSFEYLSNAGFGMEGPASSEATPLFGFHTKATEGSMEQSHNVVLPLNIASPSETRWRPGASAEGIISVAGKESKGLVGPSHSGAVGGSVATNDAMLSLELGKRTYFAVSGGASGSGTCAMQASGPALPRKQRIAGQVPGCQVEGCKTDLATAKDYHRRHKVCAVHSKDPCVIVRGVEQRFCQQCSRFHDLNAFDGDKRSCRNRLEGHNKRRRKRPADALGLNARFLPAFQDSSGLGPLFTDRSSFLPHIRSPGVAALWDECSPNQQRGHWQQRMLSFEDQSGFERSIPAVAGMERQLFTAGLHHHPSERSTLFPPRSPKGMVPLPTDLVGSKPHQLFHGSANPLGSSLSLTSSSPGAGVLSGLEAIPVGQGFPRVSDSGRALSLQSTMQLLSCTPQDTVAASSDMTIPNMVTDHSLPNNHILTAQPLVQVSAHHHFEWPQDKLLAAATNLQGLSSSTTGGYQAAGGPIAMAKDNLGGAFTHGVNPVGSYECVPLYSMFQGGTQDVKPTIDLMEVAASPHGISSQPLVSTASFDLGISHFQELQALRSYEPSIYSSQQM